MRSTETTPAIYLGRNISGMIQEAGVYGSYRYGLAPHSVWVWGGGGRRRGGGGGVGSMAELSNAYTLSGKDDFAMIQEVRASNTYAWHHIVGGGGGGGAEASVAEQSNAANLKRYIIKINSKCILKIWK